jgi:hypothetical protein
MIKLFANKKAQNTAEYAILIALVVGGVVAMQTYAQRTMQGRIRDANKTFVESTSDIGNTMQYEPYYQNTVADVDKSSTLTDTSSAQARNAVTTKEQASYSDVTMYNGIKGE